MSTDQKSHTDADAEPTSDVDQDTTVEDTTNEDTAGEETAGEETEESTADEATDPAPPRRRGPSLSVAVLAVMLVAAASVAAWLYFAQYRPSQATGPEAAQSALQAATDGTVALLSYKPDTLDADLTAAKSHLTGEFLTYYSQFTDQIVKPAAAQKKVQTTANVIRAAVSDIQAGNATVLVFVNQTTTSTDRPDPTLANSSVLVHLTKVDGRWLISEFKPV